MTGQTTRLVDEAIQVLFRDGKVEVRDHYDHPEAHKNLVRAIERRLKTEHRVNFHANTKTLTVQLIK